MDEDKQRLIAGVRSGFFVVKCLVVMGLLLLGLVRVEFLWAALGAFLGLVVAEVGLRLANNPGAALPETAGPVESGEFQIDDGVYWGGGSDEEAGIIQSFSPDGTLAYVLDYRWKCHRVPVNCLMKVGPPGSS